MPLVEEPEQQAFFSYTIRTESFFKAGIVYNSSIYNLLEFSPDEILASVLHEIGHIMFFSVSTMMAINRMKKYTQIPMLA